MAAIDCVVAYLKAVGLPAVALLAYATHAPAQQGYRMLPNKDEVEIDFLANYYTQDGNHSAVEGGLGTEQLDNVSGLVVVQTPLDSNSALQVTAGADYYSSASTDRIDNQLSTASSSDIRAHVTVGYTERQLARGRTFGGYLGLSREYDVLSLGGGASFAQEWDRGINELSFGVSFYRDRWDRIYPAELRLRGELLAEDVRSSYVANLNYARIVNPRVQFSLSADVVLMQGLLSTPFHRVYFDLPEGYSGPEEDIERLPDRRFKLPIAARVNWRAWDELTVRTFYRFYADDWGVIANTASLELAYELGEAWTLLPFYRIHRQSATDYFAEYEEHSPVGSSFYTSDWDLSELTTHKAGLGARFAPTFGVARATLGRRGLEWRQITLRLAYYTRDAEFDSYSASLGASFGLRRAPVE